MKGKGKGSPYSIAERRAPELIPVLGRQPAGDGRGREDRERGGRARLGYLSRGVRVPSYAIGAIAMWT